MRDHWTICRKWNKHESDVFWSDAPRTVPVATLVRSIDSMAPSDGSFTEVVRRTAPVPARGAWAVDRDVLLARALVAAFVLIPLVWACGFLWPPINHDVAANLDMARRWLAGDRLYRDVIDVNTPLVFLVYAVPEGLARLFGGSGAIWMVACVIAGVTASSIVSHRTTASASANT